MRHNLISNDNIICGIDNYMNEKIEEINKFIRGDLSEL